MDAFLPFFDVQTIKEEFRRADFSVAKIEFSLFPVSSGIFDDGVSLKIVKLFGKTFDYVENVNVCTIFD